ncbi:universal stress protein [Nitrosomonas sp. HPC101]|uniref:universal stress protein n=1 Tax=Nitrosomonas sp. HPC101 TaxID=1658667 RepID=UPI00136C762B|nr:universal stress protein [Nitrosomonas sp. HPC101]MXS84865.1 universal stress protein [Nitrosomonas sp. HPC101]
MPVYQHILLAVDFSPQDSQVVQKARILARQTGAKLSLIHVLDNIPMPDTPYGTVIPLDTQISYAMLETEKQKLNEVGDGLEIDPDRRWLVWGEPRQEIIRIAEQEKIDLIMVGSRGRHGLALLLGSTANSVLHHAKCDVLAVRLQDD